MRLPCAHQVVIRDVRAAEPYKRAREGHCEAMLARSFLCQHDYQHHLSDIVGNCRFLACFESDLYSRSGPEILQFRLVFIGCGGGI
jgi:hypothetical protein